MPDIVHGRLVDGATLATEPTPAPGVKTSKLTLTREEGRGRRWLAFHEASGLWIVADANTVERTFPDHAAASIYRKRAVIRSRSS